MSTAIKSLVTDKLTEVAGLQSKLTALQTEIEVARTNEMKQLHVAFGYATPQEFIVGYRNATSDVAIPAGNGNGSPGRKATRGAHGNGRKAAKSKTANGRKPRVSITPERRTEIKKFFKAGHTTMEAMTKFDISYATAQNIKDESGMVKHRD